MTGGEELPVTIQLQPADLSIAPASFALAAGKSHSKRVPKTDRGGRSTDARVDIHVDVDSLI